MLFVEHRGELPQAAGARERVGLPPGPHAGRGSRPARGLPARGDRGEPP